jgi:hypothetical protein
MGSRVEEEKRKNKGKRRNGEPGRYIEEGLISS